MAFALTFIKNVYTRYVQNKNSAADHPSSAEQEENKEKWSLFDIEHLIHTGLFLLSHITNHGNNNN